MTIWKDRIYNDDVIPFLSNSVRSEQINVQQTYGRGRKKGKYEVVYWSTTERLVKGIAIGNSNDIESGIEIARKLMLERESMECDSNSEYVPGHQTPDGEWVQGYCKHIRRK